MASQHSWLGILAFSLAQACSDSATVGSDPSGPNHPGNSGCIGRLCQINYGCPSSMGPTRVSGTVTIPAGTLPLYNAKVYIPIGEIPAAPPSGASCSRCDQVVPKDAVTSAVTDINGRFILTNVPAGTDIPLIIQVGKWRRVVSIPSIIDCTTTELPAEATRLPRNQSEGSIPRIALSTGNADALECLLRKNKLGLDDSEFTPEAGNGRVNLYAGANGANKYSTTLNGGALFTAAQPLPAVSWWDTAANWMKYDIVMLSCEGGRRMDSKSIDARGNLEAYINQGGRVFASHWQNGWLAEAPMGSALRTVATFPTDESPNMINATVNTDFTKGSALADWLRLPAVLSSDNAFPRGTLPVQGARITVGRIDPGRTQSWVYYQRGITRSEQYFSFNAPIGAPVAQQCGQMVFTDLHVSAGGSGDTSSAVFPFPTGCAATSLSAQEKALIFMLFDLTNCLEPRID